MKPTGSDLEKAVMAFGNAWSFLECLSSMHDLKALELKESRAKILQANKRLTPMGRAYRGSGGFVSNGSYRVGISEYCNKSDALLWLDWELDKAYGPSNYWGC